MTTILLFVCLSLCFKVVQSQLKCMGSPCMRSEECMSGCCITNSPKGVGKCVFKSSNSCYGQSDGDLCHVSEECDSKCCYPYYTQIGASCVQKHPEDLKCIGSNNGDLCILNTLCKSGCCRSKTALMPVAGTCEAKAKENQECSLWVFYGFYRYCPCESGLICELHKPHSITGICKKPNTENKCN